MDSKRNIMIPMQILLAIDSFKGCLSSEEVEAAFSQALTARGAKIPAKDWVLRKDLETGAWKAKSKVAV